MNVTLNLNIEMSRIVETTRRALVQLRNGRRGSGSGTIWRSDGLIITNAHVVRRRAPQVKLADGRSFPSRLLAFDEKRDLAALAIDAPDLEAIPVGHSQTLRAGDWVLALGHPWGVPGAVSAGTVIDVGIPPELNRLAVNLIQASLQLRPGHSGGPMVDGEGRLVGINTMIAGPYAGLAIPTHTVIEFLQENVLENVVLA